MHTIMCIYMYVGHRDLYSDTPEFQLIQKEFQFDEVCTWLNQGRHTYIQTHINTQAYTHTYTYRETHINTQTHTNRHIYEHTHTHIDPLTHTDRHTYEHTHTHRHTNT